MISGHRGPYKIEKKKKKNERNTENTRNPFKHVFCFKSYVFALGLLTTENVSINFALKWS